MELLDMFKHYSNKEEYGPGDMIFFEGEPGNKMYVVLEGEVEVVALSKVFEVVGPGGIVGEMALIDTGPRSAAARVKDDCERCEVAVLDEKEFMHMNQKIPWFSLRVMEELVRRLREMDMKYN